MLELILGECKQDTDPVFRILIFWIRPKMDRIRNPGYQFYCTVGYLPIVPMV